MDPALQKKAINKICRVFKAYRAVQPKDAAVLAALTGGKLYELFVLSDLLVDLSNRGFILTFVGTTLKFKASPGQIKISDSHFEVRAPSLGQARYRIFVDVEFDTLGHSQRPVSDYSRRHELDIVVTTASGGYPSHSQIALGIECKAVANFGKSLIKEALGVRRELSLLNQPATSLLSNAGGRPSVRVPASPPSEFRLVFIDPKGSKYAQSPDVFGIELKHLEP